jgi:hypothetical protein
VWYGDPSEGYDLQKTENTYDRWGHLSTQNRYQKDSLGQWDKYLRLLYVYDLDARGNQITDARYYSYEPFSLWVPEYRTDCAFDERDSLLELAHYYWNAETAHWDGFDRTVRTFDDRGRFLSKENDVWDGVDGAWYPLSKEEWAYDNGGNCILEATYVGNGTSDPMVGEMRMEYVYNALAQRLSQRSYTWSYGLAKWLPKEKRDFTYDDGGDLRSETFFRPVVPGWAFQQQIVHEYVRDTLTLRNTDRTRSSMDSVVWVNLNQVEQQLDAQGHLCWEERAQWSASLSKWQPLSRTENTYDSQGRMLSTADYQWNATLARWVGKSDGYRIDYTYDTNGNQTRCINSYWSDPAKSWVEYQRLESVFDVHDRILERNQLYMDGGYWFGNRMVCVYDSLEDRLLSDAWFSWDSNRKAWTPTQENTYYYSGSTGLEEAVFSAQWSVTVSPAGDELTVLPRQGTDLPQALEVFDLHGRCLYRVQRKAIEREALPSLPAGYYRYRLSGGGTLQYGPFFRR